jgi:DNA polymerase III epsilon subunit-like protein
LGQRRTAIDVGPLARRLAVLEGAGGGPPPATLAALADRCGVPVGRTHHALSDALTTGQIFLVLATRLERYGLGALRDLVLPPVGWRRPVRRRL